MNATRRNPPGQRRPHKRSLAILVSPSEGQPNTLLRITQDDIPAVYWIIPFAADFGRAFSVERIGLEGESTYEVNIDDDAATCSCPAGTYHGFCKHSDALRALLTAGLLGTLSVTSDEGQVTSKNTVSLPSSSLVTRHSSLVTHGKGGVS